jgi:hypothetical protein
MPAQPTWFVRLPQILAILEGLSPLPYLDRQAFEHLFGVKERRARILMQRFQGQQIGHSWTVDRLHLMAALKAVQQGEPFQWDQRRRQRVAEFARQAEQKHPARQVPISVCPTAQHVALHSLPPGVDFAPGELRIQFSSLSDFLSKLFAVGQALENDFASFEKLFEQT